MFLQGTRYFTMDFSDSDNFFEEKVTEYLQVLESLYLNGIEESDNKTYAKAYFRKVFLRKTPISCLIQIH